MKGAELLVPFHDGLRPEGSQEIRRRQGVKEGMKNEEGGEYGEHVRKEKQGDVKEGGQVK